MNKEFSRNVLTDEGLQKMSGIAELFDELLESLKVKCPEGRELSLTKTKLEEACFYAKKSIAVCHNKD